MKFLPARSRVSKRLVVARYPRWAGACVGSAQFCDSHPEQVRVVALVRHREHEYEYEHGPGQSRRVTGDRYSAKRTPEAWNALVESIRNEGVKEPSGRPRWTISATRGRSCCGCTARLT